MMAAVNIQRGSTDAIDWANRAVAAAEATGLRAELGNAYAYLGAIAIHFGVGDPVATCSRALEIYREVGNRSGEGMMLNNLGFASYFARDWRAAVEYYGLSAAAHASAGLDLQAADTANNQGEILGDQGRLEEAALVIGDAVNVLETGGGYQVVFAFRNLAVVRARQGDFAAAHDLLDRADAGLGEDGEPREVADNATRRALVYLLERRPADALTSLERAGEVAADAWTARIARLRGCAWLQMGRTTDAAVELARAVERAIADADVYEQAVAQDVLSRVVGEPDASKAAAGAAAAFDELGVIAPPRVPLA
jgi:tetratricopeptide (TPR) repeat protein